MPNNSLQPKVVLGVCAHPDDLEFVAGASLAKWAKAGASVHYLICSDGSKGSSSGTKADPKFSRAELTKTRQAEQAAAAKLIGVDRLEFLDYEDAAMESSLDLKRDIVQAIRRLRPDTVLTIDPTFVYASEHNYINHTDHRAVGQATVDAVYPLARDQLTFPDLGLKPHKVRTLLLTRFSELNYFEDASETFDIKLAALKAHNSQFPDSKQIAEFLRRQATAVGKLAACQLAEGFVRIDLD